MRGICRLVFLTALVCLFGCAIAWAQGGGLAQISGGVKDQSGAVLPGVEVTVTQTDTGVSRNVVTNETGSYVLPNLPVGPYRLEAALPGFRSFVQTGIVLQVGSNPVINVSLQVGQVSEQVEVQADAALVETRSTAVGTVVNNTLVVELPLNGRNVQELILLSGMAVGGGSQGTVRNYPTDVISVGGGLQDGLTYMVDGGTHNEPYGNLNLPLPFPDAMQEFKVETSAVPAQYGQHSAGVVNVVTKSGTNDFHGTLFEFVRNKVFNARNAFATARDGLKRNQFGGTVGGAIKQNKLFFFGGVQTTFIRSQPTTVIAYVPTPQMLAGDWTTITSPLCNQGRQVTLRAPFVNNRIDPALFSKPAVNLVTKWLPPTTDSCGQISFGRRNNSDEYNYVGKVDYQLNNKHSIFGRYELARLNAPSDYDGQNWISVSQADYTRRAHSFVLGDTYLIGTGTVNSFRGTVNFSPNEKTVNEDFFTFSDLGVKNVYYQPGLPKFAQINLNGSFSTSQVPTPGKANTVVFQASDDVSIARGTHQFGVGFNYIHSLMNYVQGSFASGQFIFNGSNVGLPMADMMVGRPSQWQQSQVSAQNYRQNYIATYLQDTWKANSHLTLNLGVRWEPYIPPYDKNGNIALFDKSWYDQGIHSSTFKNAPVGLLFTGIDSGAPNTNSLNTKDWRHVAPRVGLSWDPKGDGLTVVRAAYGMFFDYPHFSEYSGLKDTPPRGARVTVTNPPGGFDDPWAGAGGSPFPIVIDPNVPFPLNGGYTVFPHDLKKPYMQQWNLSIQRQVGSDWLVSGSYLGNNVIHMLFLHDGNPAIYMPGASCVIAGRTYTPCSSTSNTNQRRVLYLQNPAQGQYFTTMAVADTNSTRNYNAMSLSIQKRRSRGVTFQGNYTLSHCLDYGYTDIIQTSSSLRTEDRRGIDHQNCELDRRHNFNASTVYETPQFSSALMRRLGSGWKLSGIFRILSGSAQTIALGVDQALTGQSDQRPDQILPSAYAPKKSINLWLNPAAFSIPAVGTYGTLGPTTVSGPGSIRIDTAVTRTFKVREKQTVEFRVEAFNVANHVNPNNPSASLNNQNFGKITSAQDPRIMQFALKYVF
jgi:Carboxypeptidase regulatory-like domain/TonB dependent receptor